MTDEPARCEHRWIATAVLPVCLRCGREPTASPSQVETWRDCKRKWAYSRVRARRENKAADYGTRCHTILEHWLLHGTPPDPATPEGKTVLTGLHLIPSPKADGLAVEERATPVLGGPPLAIALGLPGNALGPAVAWDMRKDFRYGLEPAGTPTPDGPSPGVIVFGDHKTTGDIALRAKTPEVLSTTDPQGIAYGHDALERHDVGFAIGQWVYYQRDAKAKARAVTFALSRQAARERFAAMHVADVLPMVRARPLPPDQLPRSLDACEKFGGCPYRTECHAAHPPVTRRDHAASALTLIRSTTTTTSTETDMPDLPADLLAAIHAHNGTAPPPPTAAPAAAPANTFVPEVTTTGDAQLDRYLASLPEGDRQAAFDAIVAAQVAAGKTPTVIAARVCPPPTTDPRPPEAQAPKRRGRPPKDKSADKPAAVVDAKTEATNVIDVEVREPSKAASADAGDAETPAGLIDMDTMYHRASVIQAWLRSERASADLVFALEQLGGAS